MHNDGDNEEKSYKDFCRKEFFSLSNWQRGGHADEY